MKRLLCFVIAAALSGMLILSSCSTAQAQAQEVQGSPEWTSNRMIAHGMGGISDTAYTNSYEAFVLNYQKGHRVFEADLILTEDGKLAARHDWLPYTAERLKLDLPESQIGEPLDMNEFKKVKILGKFMPLSFRDIVRLMHLYPDIYFVTDTKETDLNLVRKQFEQIKQTADRIDPSVLDRMIPELYTQDMYHEVMDIYPFPNKLYSLYLSNESQEETVKFVKENGIQTVAMPVERAQMMPELVKALNEEGVRTYVHTVNAQEDIDAMLKLGVYGIYTDYLPNDSDMFGEGSNGEMQGGNLQAGDSSSSSPGASSTGASNLSSSKAEAANLSNSKTGAALPSKLLVMNLLPILIAVGIFIVLWIMEHRRNRKRRGR
ncbi:phosphatidylinositol-specific phospholipase C/glycerophosphodiester phosphodiesterase family protein [Paenibacillus hexagrammi]|uniref:GP-PDE domain-containing protein n=1 Tax=Paenibacillus hexagrammi TaxID=2908839 RepID=A0ABY3SJ10_9BACL|nr:phosphatidylinositol-specific phospholipase C/glycerophosphodiester phosphodiesterase family protein [Paenibacillus sp. YPD9-1]UJF33887.1 hypothetical protein L0M14_01095 [Paenibacillus sp. YPD9-1]